MGRQFTKIYAGWHQSDNFAPWQNEPMCHERAWIWMLEAACYKPQKVWSMGEEIELFEGEFRCSIRGVSASLRWSNGKTQRFFSHLKRVGAISTRPATKARHSETVVTILNYRKYSGSGGDGDTLTDTPGDTPAGTPAGTPTGTPTEHLPIHPRVQTIDNIYSIPTEYSSVSNTESYPETESSTLNLGEEEDAFASRSLPRGVAYLGDCEFADGKRFKITKSADKAFGEKFRHTTSSMRLRTYSRIEADWIHGSNPKNTKPTNIYAAKAVLEKWLSYDDERAEKEKLEREEARRLEANQTVRVGKAPC